MAKLKLTVACGDYEIVRALSDGTVQADGIELVMLTGMGSRERHWRMARKTEFDVCEINIGGYYMARDRGEALAAIPVFLHRRFRHGFVFVNAKSGIREPKDLIGKKIGGTNFQPASNIWMRGILEEYYGVPHRQCTWVVERSEDFEFTPPKDLRIEMAPPESGSTSCWRRAKSRPCCRPISRRSFATATSASCGCSRTTRTWKSRSSATPESFRSCTSMSYARRSSTNIPGSRPIWSRPSTRPRRWPIAMLPIHAAFHWPGSGPHGKSSSTSWAPTPGNMASATPIAKMSKRCCGIAINKA